MTATAKDAQQAKWIRSKFNALYATAHPKPTSGDAAVEQARRILLKLRPDDQSRESADVFKSLDAEISAASGERLEQVAIAFAVR